MESVSGIFILLLIVFFGLLGGIFHRLGSRSGDAWFTRPCPHCRQRIASKATACPWCTRDVPKK